MRDWATTQEGETDEAHLMSGASKLLTIVAMTGLGLSVDIRAVREAGHRVAAVVVGLVVVLALLALGIIVLLRVNG